MNDELEVSYKVGKTWISHIIKLISNVVEPDDHLFVALLCWLQLIELLLIN